MQGVRGRRVVRAAGGTRGEGIGLPRARRTTCPLSAPLALHHSLLFQGAQLLAQHGVNVPPGIAVTKVEDVAAAAKEMAGDDGEVKI